MKDYTTFFGKFSGEEAGSPFVIARDRIYQIASTRHDARTAYLKSGDLTLDLVVSSTLAQMEVFEERRVEEDIFLYQKAFIAQALQREIESGAQIKNYKNTKKALEFVLFEVLPLMIDTAYELGELLGVEDKGKKTGREVIDEIVKQETKEKEPEDKLVEVRAMKKRLLSEIPEKGDPILARDIAGVVDTTSVLGNMLNGASVYVVNGQVFRLVKTQTPTPFHISIDGVQYEIKHETYSKNIETRYKEALQNRWKRNAIALFDEQVLVEQVDEKRRASAEPFLEKKEFRYGNLGYIREGDSFYVYWQTPKFAMQNPLSPKEYHPFPATRIGVRVYNDSGYMYATDAIVVDPTAHPFLRNWEGRYEKICILSSGGIDSSALGIVTGLSTGINAFTNGLTMESLDRHGVRSEDARYFDRPLKSSLRRDPSIPRGDAVQQGYRITNEWNLEART